MLEHRTDQLLPRHRFLRRQAAFIAVSLAMILLALGLGTVGYHTLEAQDWLDSFYSASMILTGMGPASPVRSSAGKIFASVYALFAAGVFLTAWGVLMTPLFHRVMHCLHLEDGSRGRS